MSSKIISPENIFFDVIHLIFQFLDRLIFYIHKNSPGLMVISCSI